MDIQQAIQHHEDIRATIEMAVALILTAVMIGLTWWSFCQSETVRAERRRLQSLEARVRLYEEYIS